MKAEILGRAVTKTYLSQVPTDERAYKAGRYFARVEATDKVITALTDAVNATLATARKGEGGAEVVLGDVTAETVAAAVNQGLSIQCGDPVMSLAFERAYKAGVLNDVGLVEAAGTHGVKVDAAKLEAAKTALAKPGAAKNGKAPASKAGLL